jgi:RNA polymerase sigma-70 factor (ECF subfamily)
MTDAADLTPAELERHRTFLVRLARDLTRGEAAAEDLVQDAFVRALERPPASVFALRAWLARVLHHLAVNRMRAEERSAQRERRVARPQGVAPPDEALASLELEAVLVAAMKALDEPYRTTLWLRFHEGLAPRAIAARLDVPVKTVEARLTRGLAALRTDLDRRSGGDRTRWLAGVLVLARVRVAPWVLPIGVGVAMKNLVVVAGVLLALLFAWRQLDRSEAPPPRELARQEAPPGPLAGASVAAPERVDPERAPVAPVPAPTAVPESTALLVRVVWADDGMPAPDVGLILRPENDPRGARAVQFLRSDEKGELRLASLAPGRVRIEADRGGSVTADVVAGVETEVRFELAAGVTVEGTVSDGGGAPLAGAEVLLVADAHDWLATRVVARTAANGAYRIRAVQPELSVSARAEGFVAALLEPLRGASGSGASGSVHLDFVLAQPGTGLRGIVLDPEGRPVADALVAVGDPSGYAEKDREVEGLYREARGMRVERSGADGRFFAAGVPQGFGIAVAVQADGYPIAVANVPGDNRATSFVEIRLAPPSVLSGVVRTAAGEPAPNVHLTTIVCDGADEVPFALPAATSDGEGRYRLELLPRRSLVRLEPARGHGVSTLLELALAPGETSRDLVLAADEILRGRVEAPPGTSFDGWFVKVYSELAAGPLRRASIGADGRFEIPSCDHAPYRLDLYAAPNRQILRREHVAPGAELVLVTPALGSIRGEFVDEAGLLSAGARPSLFVSSREYVTEPPTRLDEGRFAFEGLAPERYRFAITLGDQVVCVRTVDLAPGADVDLGRIESAPPGSLVLAFDPYPSGGMGGTVVDASGSHVASVEVLDGRLGVAALPPGDWRLDLRIDGCAPVLAPFTVRPGERTELTLVPVPGVERSLAFRLEPEAWNVLTVELRDAHGALVLAQRVQRSFAPVAGAGPSVLVNLAVGTYALAAETDTGLALRTTFDVPELTPQESPLAFELR